MSEREVLTDFIELYRDYKCLWDVTDEHYRNQSFRYEGYTALLPQLQLLNPDATIDSVKKKIEYLRSAYKRERRKVKASLLNGSGEDEVYHPTLWYYGLMTFLSEDTQDTDTDHLDDIDTTNSSLAGLLRSVEYVPPKKKSKLTLEKKREADLDAVTNLSSFIEENNEIMSFGNTIGLQLSKLKDNQRHIAEKLFSDIIFYGRNEMLSLSTTINIIKPDK